MKRTIENCTVIKRYKTTDGVPKQYDGKCEGYAGADRDEPCATCRVCKLNTAMEG